MKALQVENLFAPLDQLQRLYGGQNLSSIYGAGCIYNPKFFLIFINPTVKNVSSDPDWCGIRAPWLGTKQVWEMFYRLGFINRYSFKITQTLGPEDWTKDFAINLYTEMAGNKVYVTNYAKCTQIDARPLSDAILKKYSKLLFDEILKINPSKIITFGNQVSSLLLGKPISVADYICGEVEKLELFGRSFRVLPVYYPVGQGARNKSRAVRTIKKLSEW